jgi:hypothetical protein
VAAWVVATFAGYAVAAAGQGAATTQAQVTAVANPTIEQYLLLALSTSEGIAVLKGPDRKLVTLRIGGTLAPVRARLTQVLGDRLRFEAPDNQGALETIWMIRAAKPDQAPEILHVSINAPAVQGTVKSNASIVPMGAGTPQK